MTSLPVTYRVQDGCHNCRHCRTENHQDWTDRWCVLDGIKPPKKYPGRFDSEKEDAYWEARTVWEDGREVDPAGICDQHERKADD